MAQSKFYLPIKLDTTKQIEYVWETELNEDGRRLIYSEDPHELVKVLEIDLAAGTCRDAIKDVAWDIVELIDIGAYTPYRELLDWLEEHTDFRYSRSDRIDFLGEEAA